MEFNNLGGNPDARARGLGLVTAQATFWGDGRTDESDLVLDPDPSYPQYLVVVPLATSANGLTGAGAASKSGEGGGASQGGALRGGGDGPTLAAQVRELVSDGERDEAAALLTGALATGGADLPALYLAAADLARGGLPPALRAALAATPGEAGRWARRARAVDAAARGNLEAARAHAAALAGTEAHRAFGHRMLVRLAADARDEGGALSALGAFAEAAGEADADALSASAALVAVTFPGADLGGALARQGSPFASGKAGAAAGPALTAYPNPSAGGASVLLRTEEGASATVAVHDALGRRVATLHEGPLAGREQALAIEGAGLAVGLYVVTARVTGPGGAVTTEAVRWTRTR